MGMKVTLLLVIANLVVFGLQAIVPGFTEAFALTPALAVDGAWWQFLTYMFLHGGAMHILINMFVLGIFGIAVEKQLGWRMFSLLYGIAGLGSSFLYLVLTGDAFIMMLGASGAVFGILAAYGLLFPKNWIMVFFVPMPALIAVFLIAAFELIAGVFNILPGIANFGHLGGIVVGVVFIQLWKSQRKRAPVGERFVTHEFFWE